MAAAELAFVVKAIDDASGTLKNVSGELDHMEGKASKLGSLLKGGLMLGAGVAAAGIGGLGVVLKQSVDAASEAEQVAAQLEAVLKSTGGVAGMTSSAVNDLALSLSQQTRYEDEAIVSAESMLLTFTKINKDTFPKATALTLDLATAFKMDLKSAAMMVGKALNDPVKGLTAMGRAGVQFTEAQKDMIKGMVEAGDVAAAQTVIMKELETQVGGSAKAAGETMAGQLDILKNSLGNIKEEIGFALIPVIQKFVTWIGPKLTTSLQKLSAWIKNGVTDLRQFAGTLGKAGDIVVEIVADVKAGEKIKWQDLMDLAGLFTNKLDIQRAFAGIVTDIQTGIGQIKAAFDTGGIGGALGEVWRMLGDWWTTDAKPFAAEVGGKIADWWTNDLLPWLRENAPTWEEISDAVKGAYDSLATWWTTKAVPLAQEVANNITTWFTGQVVPALKAQAPTWADGLNDVLKEVVTIGGWELGEDASLAYSLGAGWMKLLMASYKPLLAGPRVLADVLKKAFSGGIGDIDWGEVLGDVFGPIGDFLRGALDAFLLSVGGDFYNKISAWWTNLWQSALNSLGVNIPGLNSINVPQSGSAYVPLVTAPNPSNGATGSSIPGAGRAASRMGNVTINVNAPGGNPGAVSRAAQSGVLAAARSMGMR